MCGRYLFSLKSPDRASQRLLELFTRQFPGEAPPEGEIFPGSVMPVLVAGGKGLRLTRGRWGYDTGGSRLINARWETAGEKPLFRESMQTGRCVVPAAGFFEWNREKHLFRGPEPLLYLAGLCREGTHGLEFVILTRPANRYVQDVHHRMPVLLPQNALLPWVSGATQSSFDALPPLRLSDEVL